VKIALILNNGSGNALQGDALEKLLAMCAAAGCDVHQFPAGTGEEMKAAIEQAARERLDAVVVGGGDGTLGTAAGVLKDTGIPLGVLPLGTFNHFAKDLGVPLDLEKAVHAIAHGAPVAVDIAEVNGRVFINNSSLGIYPSIVRWRDQLRSRLGLARGKLWTFAWAALTALRRAPFLDVQLCMDGGTQRLRAPFLFVGNNEYDMEGFDAGTRKSVRSGTLSVYMTRKRSRLRLIALGLRALFGSLRQARDFEACAAQTLEVRSRHKYLLVATDGEVQAMRTPLNYRIHRGALNVLLAEGTKKSG
jgi:diacylglycerol kinase family enzyme